ncbi:MAG: S-methyl-5'-thioadenosine phosphorylase [Chloroflexi bacterium]|nr:S-methyl-5'-thioadenosine phosphorylase [Chloroflexota bacterium]MCL5108339.1 S-methyl-5'-thioadenosine phosphorylase [Chloroflexota bacterium]
MPGAEATIAVIGGSGLYEMDGLRDVHSLKVSTPFGDPSDEIVVAQLGEQRIAFLPRHGRGHRLSPSEVPSRANIYALKTLGVEHIVSVSAVGSLREDIAPLHAVIPDQLFDRTRRGPSTFFGHGLVAHISFAEPFCPELSAILYDAAKSCGATVHRGGVYVCIEGPQFSTKGESQVYRQWGMDIIGMTALPEAKLAREAEICYATLAFVTDYDVWRESEEPVTVAMIVGNLLKNVRLAKRIVKAAVPKISAQRECVCAKALQNAIITSKDRIPENVKEELAPIIGRYV